MSVAERGFVELGAGRRVAYAVSGPSSGVPILLNHPIGGSMALWGTFGERLAGGTLPEPSAASRRGLE